MSSQVIRNMVISRYKSPQYKSCLEHPDICHGDVNISCGDEITVFAKFDPDSNADAGRFLGTGCTISQVSADILCEMIEGMSMDEILTLDFEFVKEMLGFPVTHSRTKCAILPLKVLQAGILLLKNEGKEAATQDLNIIDCTKKVVKRVMV